MFHFEAEAKLKTEAEKCDQQSLRAAEGGASSNLQQPMMSGEEIRESRLVVGEAAPPLSRKNRRKK